jgi:DNA repair protein RadC
MTTPVQYSANHRLPWMILIRLCGAAYGIPLLELFGFTSTSQKSLEFREDRAAYVVHPQLAVAKELFTRALHETLSKSPPLNTPDELKAFLRCKIGHLDHEVFGCIYLTSQNHFITLVEHFRGTVTQTSVFPRAIVRAAIEVNASAVVFFHNHPSGTTQPSRADEALTQTLKTALTLVDVRVLDHFIVTTDAVLSFAERGLI